MTCTDCSAAEQTKWHWRQYNTPQCPYCTARLIQQIGRLASPTSDAITARRRAVLQDAVAWGHRESLIRELAKSKTMAVEPVQTKGKK